MNKLLAYFVDGIKSRTLQTVGAEVETQFLNSDDLPIAIEVSQKMFDFLSEKGWKVQATKGNLITGLVDGEGNQLSYELGRHNLEISTRTGRLEEICGVVQKCLNQLYRAGEVCGAKPLFGPLLVGQEDLLVVPDDRDAAWLAIDGREALAPLARTSSVQFTISVSPEQSIRILNNLGGRVDSFLADYPQETVWRNYISNSWAKYRSDRYGGPLLFSSIDDYCNKLALNEVVVGTKMTSFEAVEDLNIPLFLRSIWWYFRLKRYGQSLVIEVRPMPRGHDEQIPDQLKKVVDLFNA